MSKKKTKEPTFLLIDQHSAGRLDKYLGEKFPEWSRTSFKRLIDGRHILVDGHPVSAHHKLRLGQRVTIKWPQPAVKASGPFRDFPFPILIEEDEFFVMNKPPRVLCHPPNTRFEGDTLLDFLPQKLSGIEWPDDMRPGLVHRLDRDTSGCLIIAKTPEAHMKISRQFSQRRVHKTYIALVSGLMPSAKGRLECKMGRDPAKRKQHTVALSGRLAITDFEVLEKINNKATLVQLHPLTGRTHQLRVQLSYYGHPIFGDELYGNHSTHLKGIDRHLLHAQSIEFYHPKSGKKVRAEAPLPEDFQKGIKLIRFNS